jgi:Family of unknown function (DUF6544)
MALFVILLILFAYWLYERSKFESIMRGDVNRLFAEMVKGEPAIVTEAMLENLPEPVKRYLRYAGVVGKPIPRTVRLKQHGRFRMNPERPWMSITAEEYYSINPPAFVWIASAKMGSIPLFRGRDMYQAGKGNMNIRVGSVMTVVNAVGDAIDQGSMMRYLSEIIGFPAAFLCDNISFEAVDNHSAKVTLTDCRKTAAGTLFIDEQGRLTDFVALRYTDMNGKYELETWSTPITAYGEFEGLRLPSAGKAVWKLKEGDLEYVDVDITDIEYDAAETF